MPVLAQLCWAAACAAGCLLLGYAGIRHVTAPRGLAGVLRAHGVLPRPVVSARAVAIWAGVEVVAGVAGLGSLVGAGWALPATTASRLPVLGCAALFLGYGGYLLTVRRLRGVVPCGCLGDAGRTSRAAAARVLVLAALCGGYALQPRLPAFSPAGGAGILCGAVLLAGIVVVLDRLSAVLRPVAATSG